MTARPWVCAALAAFTLSCDSPTDPADRGGVGITASIIAGPSTELHEGWPWLTCDVRFVASAEGKGLVRWRGATAHWYYGIDRSVPVDTLVLNGGDIESAFIGDSLLGQGSDTAEFRIAAPAPFEIEVRFRYTRGSQMVTHTSAARARCGPAIPPDTPQPTVEVLEVTANTAQPQPGDVVTVKYRVAGAAGIWLSGVEFSASFLESRWFVEGGVASRERTAEVTIPANASLDFPVRVLAYAYDAALRVVTVDTISSILVKDLTPPTMTATISGGQWATDEAIRVQGTAADNHSLSWIVWQLGDPAIRRDSVPVLDGGNPSAHPFDFQIPVRPEWVGLASTLKLWSRDGAGHISAPISSVANGLRFYPAVTLPPLEIKSFGPSAGVSGGAYDVLYDARRDRLYVAHPEHSAISSFEIGAWTRGPVVATPARPYSIAFTPSGDSLVVAHAFLSQLSVVRLADLALASPIPVHAIDTIDAAHELVPSGVRVTSNGTALIELDGTAADGTRAVTVDLASGSSRARRDAARGQERLGEWFRRMRETPDGQRIAIFELNCARYYRAATDDFGSCAPLPHLWNNDITISSDGTRMTFWNEVRGANFELLQTLPTQNALIAPDGQTAFVLRESRLIRVRVSDGRYLAAASVPLFANTLIMLADGQTLIVLDRGGGGMVKVPLGAF